MEALLGHVAHGLLQGLGQVVRKNPPGVVVLKRFLVPFGLVAHDPMQLGGKAGKIDLRQGHDPGFRIAEERDIELPACDILFHQDGAVPGVELFQPG